MATQKDDKTIVVSSDAPSTAETSDQPADQEPSVAQAVKPEEPRAEQASTDPQPAEGPSDGDADSGTSGDQASEDAATRDTTSEDTASEDTAREDTASQDASASIDAGLSATEERIAKLDEMLAALGKQLGSDSENAASDDAGSDEAGSDDAGSDGDDSSNEKSSE
ncbi:MAG: hypothetical protein KJO36_04735 [Acidimicrobiia bacterium]|nr:hypothetical protein [Acidimicrobiia bacterium]